MNFNEYQAATHKTNVSLDRVTKKFPNLHPTMLFILSGAYLGLGLGESGELQNKLKKLLIRDKPGEFPSKEELDLIKKELGDQMWYISEIANLFKLSLDDIAQSNILKLLKRNEEGMIHGSGDDRTVSLLDESNLANKGYFVVPLPLSNSYALLLRRDSRTPPILYIVGCTDQPEKTKELYGFTSLDFCAKTCKEHPSQYSPFSTREQALKMAALLDVQALNLKLYKVWESNDKSEKSF